MSDFTNFVNKYFEETIILPDFSFQDNKDLFYKDLTNFIQKLEIFDEQSFLKEINININKGILVKFYQEYFKSVRSYILFKNILKQELSKYLDIINIYDLILLSLLKSCDIKLFNFIINNGYLFYFNDFLLEKKTNFGYSQFSPEKRKEIYTLKLKNFTEIQKEIILELFPNIKKYLNESMVGVTNEQIYNDIIDNKRFANLYIFQIYTQTYISDTTKNYLLTEDLKNDIINSSITFENLEKNLKKMFPEGDYNYDLRRLSLDWIKNVIKTLQYSQSKNIIIALSHVAKNFSNINNLLFGLSDKLYSAHIFIDFIKFFNNKDIINDILKDDNASDSFATIGIFYSLKDKNELKNLELTENDLLVLVESFFERLKSKKIPDKSIFDSSVSDDALQIYWRWYDCETFLKENGKENNFIKLKDYLLRIFKVNQLDFFTFVKEFINIGLPGAIQKEQLKNLLLIFNKKDIKDFVENNIEEDTLNNLDKILLGNLNKWLNSA